MRGPLSILKELLSKEIENEEVQTAYQYMYIVYLREKLEQTCEVARSELEKSAQRYKKYADVKSENRQLFQEEDEVLLSPSDSNKLIMQWNGPIKVVQKMNPDDYKVSIKGKVKTYHASMLKKYFARSDQGRVLEDEGKLSMSCVSEVALDKTELQEDSVKYAKGTCEIGIQFPITESNETVDDVQINEELDSEKKT